MKKIAYLLGYDAYYPNGITEDFMKVLRKYGLTYQGKFFNNNEEYPQDIIPSKFVDKIQQECPEMFSEEKEGPYKIKEIDDDDKVTLKLSRMDEWGYSSSILVSYKDSDWVD